MIHLETEFNLQDHINVICLPESTNFTQFQGQNCFAAGWGQSQSADNLQYSDILNYVNVPFVESKQCQNLLRTAFEEDNYALDESFNCAGGKFGEDTCKGDGGGPLFCPLNADPERFVQLGITATGLWQCGKEGAPGIYANVPNGICFIKIDTFCKVIFVFFRF